jgi:hypothetical protein
LKVTIFVIILAMLAAGSVVAQENGALPSRTLTAADAGFNLEYGNDQIAGRAIDERIIDRLNLFDRQDDGDSARYTYRSTWRMKIATGVSKSLSRWNFDWNSGWRGQRWRPRSSLGLSLRIRLIEFMKLAAIGLPASP